MDYEEEQKNELDALSEIYYNEIEVISSKAPISFSIRVRPQASEHNEAAEVANYDSDCSDDDDEDCASTDEGAFVSLKFELPAKYPDEKPQITVLETNLDADEIAQLRQNLDRTAEESLGMVMVSTLVSDVVEWLSSKSEEEDEAAAEQEEENEKRKQEADAEEKRRFEGTPVTVETFLAWKAKFDAELLKAKLDEQKNQPESNTKRLTGRAMFESDQTLAESDLNFVEDLDQNQIEALLHKIDEVEITSDDDEFDFKCSDEDDVELEISDEDDDDEEDDDDDN